MDADDPRSQAAAALRRLGHTLMVREADDDLLLRVAADADRVTEDLSGRPRRRRDYVDLKKRMYESIVIEGERVGHFDECFVSGRHNPLGIAMDVHREGDEMVARVHLGAAFEGAPGRAHGGIVSAIFDDILGYLGTMLNTPAFTGSLTVDYLAPTPIETPLEFRARVAQREGRKLLTEAEARADGEVVARARATFIIVPIEAFRK